MGGSRTAQQCIGVSSFVLNLGNRFSKSVAGSSTDPPTVLLNRTEELDVSNRLVLQAGLAGGLNGN
jgi:hypothetical protein